MNKQQKQKIIVVKAKSNSARILTVTTTSEWDAILVNGYTKREYASALEYEGRS